MVIFCTYAVQYDYNRMKSHLRKLLNTRNILVARLEISWLLDWISEDSVESRLRKVFSVIQKKQENIYISSHGWRIFYLIVCFALELLIGIRFKAVNFEWGEEIWHIRTQDSSFSSCWNQKCIYFEYFLASYSFQLIIWFVKTW